MSKYYLGFDGGSTYIKAALIKDDIKRKKAD